MNMSEQPQEIDNLLGEIQLMRGLSHPHIVEYLGAWVDAAEGGQPNIHIHFYCAYYTVSFCSCLFSIFMASF